MSVDTEAITTEDRKQFVEQHEQTDLSKRVDALEKLVERLVESKGAGPVKKEPKKQMPSVNSARKSKLLAAAGVKKSRKQASVSDSGPSESDDDDDDDDDDESFDSDESEDSLVNKAKKKGASKKK